MQQIIGSDLKLKISVFNNLMLQRLQINFKPRFFVLKTENLLPAIKIELAKVLSILCSEECWGCSIIGQSLVRGVSSVHIKLVSPPVRTAKHLLRNNSRFASPPGTYLLERWTNKDYRKKHSTQRDSHPRPLSWSWVVQSTTLLLPTALSYLLLAQ